MKRRHNLLSEISVTYNPCLKSSCIISNTNEAYKAFLPFFPSETIQLQERFLVMYLNRSNKVLGIYPVSIGGITGTVADPRLILGVAVKVAATGMILAHNHPSGSTKPSQADFDITMKIKEASRYLDIKVLDHLIVSFEEGAYYSMAESGVL